MAPRRARRAAYRLGAQNTIQEVIHLDTSFLIRVLVRGTSEDRAVRGWLAQGTPVGISAVAWAEFLCGPLSAAQFERVGRLVGPALPFEPDDAEIAAQLFNSSGRRRGTLADCMIAATAIRAGVPLATSNRSDFAPFESAGLRLAAV